MFECGADDTWAHEKVKKFGDNLTDRLRIAHLAIIANFSIEIVLQDFAYRNPEEIRI